VNATARAFSVNPQLSKLQLLKVDNSSFSINTMEMEQPPPTLTNPRFILELEFVSSLANPYYLSHLAVTYPNLLGISHADDDEESASPDAQAFAAYLAYLYSYWKTPEYSQFLTHPGPTLRALRLLQEDKFRRDIILPQVIEGLAGINLPAQAQAEADGTDEKQEDGQNGKT
jgi:mediator of RNA polymerase II transcription subunit 31